MFVQTYIICLQKSSLYYLHLYFYILLCQWYYRLIDVFCLMPSLAPKDIKLRTITYRLDRLKPKASNFRGPPAKVYNIFNTVTELSHWCCHSVMYFLNNPSVIFLTQLHSISEYCTPHHLCLYWNWLNTLPCSSCREGG